MSQILSSLMVQYMVESLILSIIVFTSMPAMVTLLPCLISLSIQPVSSKMSLIGFK
jgi:hypothetical protein